MDSLPSGSFYKRDLPDEHLILEPEITGFGSFEDSFEVTAYDDLSGRIRIRRQEVDEDGDDDDADGDGKVAVVVIAKSNKKPKKNHQIFVYLNYFCYEFSNTSQIFGT